MALAIIAGIGAATSIVGGIFGASQADQQNQAAQNNYDQQKRLAQQAADKANEYNKRAFEVDKQNYFNQYNYQWDSAVQSWQRGNEIQDYRYLQDLRMYQRDLGIQERQLDFNDLAGKTAYAAEDAALTNIFKQQMFEREDQVDSLKKTLLEGELNRYATQAEFNAATAKGKIGSMTIQDALNQYTQETSFKKESAMIENIKAQGRNELRQAGTSRQKGQQATMADFYRGMSQLEASLSGTQRKAALQLLELGVDTSLTKTRLGIQRTQTDMGMLNAVRDAQFNMRVLDADVASAVEQSLRNRSDISLRQYGADLTAIAQTMIRPERLSYEPTPIKPPERIFIEPMEVIPGGVAMPVQQSVVAPIFAGLGSAASSLASIDWKSGGKKTRD